MPRVRLEAPDDEPEIAAHLHMALVQWMLYRAFSRPDSDTHDPGRAAVALDVFERYFGPRPNADLRRSTRHDEAHATVGYFL